MDENLQQAFGMTIATITLKSNLLLITFEDGSILELSTMQDCCESRYFTAADDELSYHQGTILYHISDLYGEEKECFESYGVTEKAFLDIKTSNGILSFTCYNEHSGYYSGFILQHIFKPSAAFEEAKEQKRFNTPEPKQEPFKVSIFDRIKKKN